MPPYSTYNLRAKNQSNFLNKIKGSALYGGRNERTGCISPSVCGVHTYGGRCYFVAILSIMYSFKNYLSYLLKSEESLTDYQLFILMRKGGAL